MTIGLWDWLEHLNFMVGADFPEADEDALRRCGHAWTTAAAELRVLTPAASRAENAVVGALGGGAGEAFSEVWHPFAASDGHFEQLGGLFDQLAAACERTALDVEYAKLEYIGALVALGVTLAALTASLVAGGVSALGMPVAIAAAQITIRLVITRLITAILAGAVFNVGLDVAAQLVQFADGHRHEWDSAKTERAALDGAIFGGIGGGVFLGAGRMMSPAWGRLAASLGLLGAAGATGTVGGVVVPLVHGEAPSLAAVLQSTPAGTIGGIGALHGHGGSADVLAAADAARLDALDPASVAHLSQPAVPGELRRAVEADQVRLDSGSADSIRDTAAEPAALQPSGSGSEHVLLDGTESAMGRAAGLASDEFVAPPDRTGFDPSRLDVGPVGDPVRATESEPTNPPAGRSTVGSSAVSPVRVQLHGRSSAAESGPGDGLIGAPGLARAAAAVPVTHNPSVVEAAGPVPASSATATDVAFAETAALGGVPGGPRPDGSFVPPAVASAAGFDRVERAADPMWSNRGADEGLPRWVDSRGRALSGVENLAVNRLAERARMAEPMLTPIASEVAALVGGTLIESDHLKTADSLKAKLLRTMAKAKGSGSFDDAVAGVKDSVRYTIVLPEERYTGGSHEVIARLLDRGLQPVAETRNWGGSAGYVGLNTVWFHEGTGHIFEVQLHTPASFEAKSVSHPLFEGIRDLDESDELSARRAQHDAYFVDVPVPPGAAEVGIPPSVPRHVPTVVVPDIPRARSADTLPGWDPASPGRNRDDPQWTPPPTSHESELGPHVRPGHDGDPGVDPRQPVTDAEAMELGRRHVVGTAAGLAFYPVTDLTRHFAAAVKPTPGYVTLDLHGSAHGFQIDHGLLTADQFVSVLRGLRADGLLALPEGTGLRLISCDTAVGGYGSPAAVLARELGVEVVAPDEPVWTTIDGLEIVSSPVLVNGNLVPRIPPDGHWRRFSPTGREIPGGSP